MLVYFLPQTSCVDLLSPVLSTHLRLCALPQLCHSAVPGLADFLKVAQTWDKAPLYGVFSTLFAVVVVEKRHLLQKVRPDPPKHFLLLFVFRRHRMLTDRGNSSRHLRAPMNDAVLLFLKMTRPEEVVTPESVEDLPPLSGLLLSVILKSSSLTR